MNKVLNPQSNGDIDKRDYGAPFPSLKNEKKRKEGKKEGRKDGRKEGRKEGRKDGRKERKKSNVRAVQYPQNKTLCCDPIKSS